MTKTGQNTSSAVMQQRAEADDSLDDFPTPPWATRALMEHAIGPTWGLESIRGRLPQQRGVGQVAWEPCCNRGFMAKPLGEYFGRVHATDIFDYGWDGMAEQADFLFHKSEPHDGVDWVIGNPPFRLAHEFIERGRQVARVGFAFLVRTSFLEGGDRYRQIFAKHPPNLTAQFAERVIMHKGILRDPSKRYWDPEAVNKKTGKKGAWKKPSTATSYCWLVWIRDWSVHQRIVWIPPCRKLMERAGDYPDVLPDSANHTTTSEPA